jgi:GT2 family glycosyltransferase
MSPAVSVIIPAYNAEDTIKQCIESILNQTYKNIAIIVIDDGSTDNTAKIAATLKCNLIKLNNNIGYVNVLNVGLKSAKGDYVYIIDSDCVVEKDCIEWLLNSFSKSTDRGVVGGTCVIPPDYKSIIALSYDVAERSKDIKNLAEIYVPYLSGSNLCIKREVINNIGEFDKRLISHCDFEFTFRAKQKGYKILFQPKAVSYHYNCRTTLKNYLDHAYRGGIYGTIFRLKYKPTPPLSRFYPNSPLIFSLIAPAFILYSILRILKKNIGIRHARDILITFPIILLGQAVWGLGCVIGAWKFKKEGHIYG